MTQKIQGSQGLVSRETKDLKENKEKDHMLAFVAKRTSSSRTKPLPDWDTH